MTSLTTERFRKSFDKLPEEIKLLSRKNYRLWKQDPFHKSLRFKKISPQDEIYSIRIGKGYRAIGVKEDNLIIWYWIGSHSDYDKLIKKI